MLGILNSLHECSELSTRCRQLAIRPYDYLASGFCPRAIYPDSELSRTAAQAFFRLSGQNTAFLANTARFHCLAGRVSSIYSAHFWVFRAGFWSERCGTRSRSAGKQALHGADINPSAGSGRNLVYPKNRRVRRAVDLHPVLSMVVTLRSAPFCPALLKSLSVKSQLHPSLRNIVLYLFPDS